MKMKLIAAALIALCIQTTFAQFTVPGTANPWLAGMSNGTTSLSGDSVPGESPVLVTGLTITGGAGFYFSASGLVSNDPRTYLYPLAGPNGNSFLLSNVQGVENGIANVTVPQDSLLGVFLTSTAPNLNPAPGPLDFSTLASRDYLSLSPALQQPFFIGTGQTSSGVQQQVVAPAGATELFLGEMDGSGWYNNVGSFTVNVSAVPEPNTTCTASILLVAMGICSLRSRKHKHTN